MRRALPLLFLLLPSLTWACLHLPADYPGGIGQSQQEALVFWNQGREVLVLRNDFMVEAEGEALPAKLAWVVPVPSLPDGYGVGDPGMFSDLIAHFSAEEAWIRDATGTRRPWTEGEDEDAGLLTFSEDGGISLYSPAAVGPYQIQPLRAGTAEALNAWLVERGFSPVAEEATQYYTERNWVWLCVEVDPAAGERSLSDEGRLSPLQIEFASERPVYPLKFSTHQGEFDVSVWLITERPLAFVDPYPEDGLELDEDGELELEDLELDEEAELELDEEGELMFEEQGLSPDPLTEAEVTGRWMPIPNSVDAAQLKAAREGRFQALDNRVGIRVPHVTHVNLYVSGEEIAHWQDDLFFPAPVADLELPAVAPGRDVARGPEPEVTEAAEQVMLESLFTFEDYPRLIALLDARIAAAPTWSDHLLRADAYRAWAGDYTFARADYLAAAADYGRVLELGLPEPEDRLAGELLFDPGLVAADIYRYRAECLLDASAFEQALSSLAQLPADVCRRPRGFALLALGRWKDAQREFTAACASERPDGLLKLALAAAAAFGRDLSADGRPLALTEQVLFEQRWWRLLLNGEWVGDGWEDELTAPLFQLVQGTGSLDAVLQLAQEWDESGEPQVAAQLRGRAHCFLALAAERAGDAEGAKQHYRACVDAARGLSLETLWASGRLAP